MLNRLFQCHYILNMFYDLKKSNLNKNLFTHNTFKPFNWQFESILAMQRLGITLKGEGARHLYTKGWKLFASSWKICRIQEWFVLIPYHCYQKLVSRACFLIKLYLQSTYYVPGIVLGAKDIAVNKPRSSFHEAHVLVCVREQLKNK